MRPFQFRGGTNAWAQLALSPIIKSVLGVKRCSSSLSEHRSTTDDRQLREGFRRARNAPLASKIFGRVAPASQALKLCCGLTFNLNGVWHHYLTSSKPGNPQRCLVVDAGPSVSGRKHHKKSNSWEFSPQLARGVACLVCITLRAYSSRAFLSRGPLRLALKPAIFQIAAASARTVSSNSANGPLYRSVPS